MAKRVPGWVKGVGIGCGAVVLLIVASIAGGAFFLRHAVNEFEDTDALIERVSVAHGPVKMFRPDPNGTIPPDRIEAFLSIRERAAAARAEADRALSGLDAEDGVIRSATAATSLLPSVAAYQRELHRVMLDAGMGHGEYYHLYALVYYAWLGKPLDDGPSFRVVSERGYYFDTLEPIPESVVREQLEDLVRATLNRSMKVVLRNQHEDLSMLDREALDRDWADALETELAAMREDPRRIPWQDGLPEIIASSLTPYRDRLEAAYSPLCNPIEIGPAARE